MRTNRSEIERWCRDHGVWPRYLELRDALKELGVSPSDARNQAFAQVQDEVRGGPLSGDVAISPGPEVEPAAGECPADPDGDVVTVCETPGVMGPNDVTGECTYMQTLIWVGENVRVPTPDWSKCPSKLAVSMWDTYRKSPSAFFERVMPKPTRQEVGDEDRFTDDGRELVEMISKVERAQHDALADETAG